MRPKSFSLQIFAALMVLTVLLTAFLPAVSAVGEEDNQNTAGLQMSAAPAFEGFFKYGEWLPVWVELENSGSDLQGELQARVSGSSGTNLFAVPVSLPAGSRKRVPLYVLVNNFSHALDINLIVDGKAAATTRVQVTGVPNIEFLVGVVAPEQGAMALIKGIELPGMPRTKMIVSVPLSDLPERKEGLRSFDVLILNDTDTSPLTPDQKAALESWVYNGGRLVIGGGAGGQRTLSGLPESLLPIESNEQVEVEDLAGLVEFAGAEPVRVPGPFLAFIGKPNSASTLASQDGLPLVVEKAAGTGQVDFIALDLAADPFDAWSGTTSFWQTLLSPGSAYPEWLPPDMSSRQMMAGQITYALSNLPSLDLPSIRSLAVLLSLYILLVGPFNYLFLRWRGNLHLAWITIPIITVAFSGGAFGIGYLLRGNDLILNKIDLVESQPNGLGQVTTYFGLFSPAQTSYEVSVDTPGLLSPLAPNYDPWSGGPVSVGGEVVFVQDKPSRLRGLSINQWSMQTFMTEGTWEDLGVLSGDLRFEGDQLVGSVSNETRLTLEDSVLILGNQFVRFGTLEPGQEVEVSLNMPNFAGPDFGPPISYRLFEQELNRPSPSGPPREIQLKQSVLDTVFQWGSGFSPIMNAKLSRQGASGATRATVLGWFHENTQSVLVSGRVPAQQSTGLFYTQIPYTFPESGEITIPPGLVSGAILEMPTEGGMCGSSNQTSVYLARGSAVFEFTIPEDLRSIQLQEILVSIGTDSGWNQVPMTEVYQWDTQSWSELENAIVGVNTIPAAGNLVSLDGRIRVRISTDNQFSGGCNFYAVGLKGTR